MKLSQHAQKRSQQRAIPRLLIDLLDLFGAEERAGNGSVIQFFDKLSLRHLKAYAGPLANVIEQYRDVYIVVSRDGDVITVGYRYEHIRRH